ncbi:ORF6N domain-containing protein [Gardnerella piotii]|uniref:ORF6N domain-containing protein n=1 Tax=Gardnerella TaxID=2701 RepID=UPI0039EFF4F2
MLYGLCLIFVILFVIHGYTTARFNEQVKNNIEKFDSDFMFQLNKSELEYLQSNFFDRKY